MQQTICLSSFEKIRINFIRLVTQSNTNSLFACIQLKTLSLSFFFSTSCDTWPYVWQFRAIFCLENFFPRYVLFHYNQLSTNLICFSGNESLVFILSRFSGRTLYVYFQSMLYETSLVERKCPTTLLLSVFWLLKAVLCSDRLAYYQFRLYIFSFNLLLADNEIE